MNKINRPVIPMNLVTKKNLSDLVEAERALEENFEADGKKYLVRCPKCKKENYAPAVSTGQCAWCGYKEDE